MITKASRLTYAKRGYFVSSGAYPRMKQKYVRTKKQALTLQKRWNKQEKKMGRNNLMERAKRGFL